MFLFWEWIALNKKVEFVEYRIERYAMNKFETD